MLKLPDLTMPSSSDQALGAAVLEIQVGVVKLVRHHAGEHLLDMASLDGIRNKQRLLRGGEQRIKSGILL